MEFYPCCEHSPKFGIVDKHINPCKTCQHGEPGLTLPKRIAAKLSPFNSRARNELTHTIKTLLVGSK
jgi:hypothetical protein